MNPLTIIAIALAPLSLFAFYYAALWIIRRLADRNLFFTIVEESTVKAVMTNGQFSFLLMAFYGRDFTRTIVGGDNASYWDIKDTENIPEPWSIPFLKGIRWIGFPPFNDVYEYKFEWSSLEDVLDKATGKLEKQPVARSKTIDYILAQSDIYVAKLNGAECSDKIPLDSRFLIGGKITNAYKALFRIERWLEASENLISAQMRDFFGSKTYEELVGLSGKSGADSSELSTNAIFATVIETIRSKYGFLITTLKIDTIEPGSALASKFIEASTQVYVAEQLAKSRVAEGQGLAARDTTHYKALSEIPNAPEMYKWDKIAESNLGTYVEGGSGVKPTVAVGGPSDPKKDPDVPAAPSTGTTI